MDDHPWHGDSVPDWREIARRDVERFRATIDELLAARDRPELHDSDSGCEVEP